jgi:hypothetical protein
MASLIGLSSLISMSSFARGGGGGGHGGGHSSGGHSSGHSSGHASSHSSGFHGSVGKSGHITRTGRGGTHGEEESSFSRNRTIFYNHNYHQSTQDYSDYYNQLLNDLDSIPVKDSTLDAIKTKLAWSNHQDTLDIPGIANQLKIVAHNQGYSDIETIIDSLSVYNSDKIKSMSDNEKDRTKKKFEIVIQDLKVMAEDEGLSPLATAILLCVVILIVIIIAAFTVD